MTQSLWQNLGHAFTDRVAIVTGGTDGIGRDIALQLALAGCHVWVCGRSREKGEKTAALCPSQIHFVPTDLTDSAACISFVKRVTDAHGAVDYLVNNAADDSRIAFEDVDDAAFEKQMAINLRPLFTITRAALPALKSSQGKAIVNLCTTNYMLGLVPFTLYNAGKSAIIGMTRSLARELGSDNIRVNTVSPGWIMTLKQLEKYCTPDDQKQLLHDQCLKRLMTPEDVTPTVMYLLSQLARGVTGQNIIVDGGKVMQ